MLDAATEVDELTIGLSIAEELDELLGEGLCGDDVEEKRMEENELEVVVVVVVTTFAVGS